MNVIVGGETIRLGNREFVASGGEGSVYAIGDTAYKIYTDPADTIPQKKIKELSVLDRDCFIRPLLTVFNSKQKPIGYTMTFLKDTFSLCQAFTKAFKTRHDFTMEDITDVVLDLREGVRFCHEKGILIVDLNEFNFLLKGKMLFYIDVDSYQTPSYPAPAIMESIRDRHNSTFSEGTDWFSFAVVSFQLFTGIHPYKGRHPNIKGLAARMEANVSVLSDDVSVPPAFSNFQVIPSAYLDWYKAVLENGKRFPPPESAVATIGIVPVEVVKASKQFKVKKLETFDQKIKQVWAHAVLAGSEMYWEDCHRTVPVGAVPFRTHDLPQRVGGLQDDDMAAWLEDGKVVLLDAKKNEKKTTDIYGEELTSDGNYLLVKNGPYLRWVDVAKHYYPMVRQTFEVMEKATKLFDGLVVQDILGACYASIYPDGSCYQWHVRELDGYEILNARYVPGFVVMVGRKGQNLLRLVARELGEKLKIGSVEEVSSSAINCASRDGKLLALLEDSGDLRVSAFAEGQGAFGWGSKIFEQSGLGQVVLASGSRIRFFEGSSLYQLETCKS